MNPSQVKPEKSLATNTLLKVQQNPLPTDSLYSQLLHNPQHTNTERHQPRRHPYNQHPTQCLLLAADRFVVWTRSGHIQRRVPDHGEALVVARPAVVEEGVECERHVGGAEDDEVEVAE